ncbi:hypothetical protein RKD45_004564 [Streptomyces griseus]
MPRYLPVARLVRRPADVHLRGQRGREVLLPDPGQRVRDRGVRPQDDRLGRHQPARGPLLVRQQAPYVGGVVRPHQGQQPLLVGLRQLREQVGRVVRVHRLQDVRGAVLRQLAEDLHLVVTGELLQDVREAVVVEGRGDLGPALGRQVVQGVGDVGGAQPFEGRHQVLGALPVLLQREAADRRPLHGQGLALAAQGSAAALAHEELVDLPVAAGRELLDGDVEDGHLLVRLHETHPPVKELAQDESLGRALLEPPHVDHAGGDDLTRLDPRHPGHRHEDAPPADDLDDHAEQPGRLPADPEHRHQVAYPAHLVAVGVEHRYAGEVRDENPGSACGHPVRSLRP